MIHAMIKVREDKIVNRNQHYVIKNKLAAIQYYQLHTNWSDDNMAVIHLRAEHNAC